MKIYLDKEGLTDRKLKFGRAMDAEWNVQEMYRAVFSDGSSCSCWFGTVCEPELDWDDESKCHASYGISFAEDEGRMSEDAWEFASEYAQESTEVIEVPSVKDGDRPEPDYDKLSELGEKSVEKLYDSMTELTKRNDLYWACW